MKTRKKKLFLIFLLLSLIIFVIGVFLFSNLLDYLSILEKQEFYTKVVVSDHYGVDVNSSALIFGMLVPGSSSVRKVTITNDHKQEVNVEIFVKGDMIEFIKISENDFDLKIDESKEIVFVATSPSYKEFGIYEGNVIFVIKTSLVK